MFWDYLNESLDVLSCLSPWKKSRIPRIQIIPFLTVFPLRLCGLWGNPSTFSTISLPISLLYYSLYHWLNSKESICSVRDTGDMGSVPGLGRSPGGGHATHSSILAWRILMDRGAWQATVCGDAKSQTGLKLLSMLARTHLYVCLFSSAHSSRGRVNKQGNLGFFSGVVKTGNLHSHFFFFIFDFKKKCQSP